MATTYDTTTVQPYYYIRNYRNYAGVPCLESTVTMGYSNRTTLSRRRNKDTRPRPADLMASMSGQPLVYRQDIIPGLFRKEVSGVVTCAGIGTFPYTGYDQQSPIGYGSYSDPPLPTWQNEVRGKFGAQTVNLASSCAEYRETGKMFVDLARGARDAWNDMRKLRFGKYLKPKKWAQMQLQYKFGVKPLVEDTVEAAIRLNAHLGFPPRGVIHASEQDTGKYEATSPYGGTRVVMSVRVARATIVYQNATGRQFMHAGTPLEWAWELIPFSFVMDWGIQVGEWLTSLDALRGISSVGGVVSDKITRTGVADYVPYPGYVCVRPVIYRYESHSRATVSSIPMAKLKYEPSVTLGRVKTALQLLTSAKSPSPSNWWRPFH